MNSAPLCAIYEFDGWQLNVGRRSLTNPQNENVQLTNSEFNALHRLCQHPQQVITREKLGGETPRRLQDGTPRSVDVLVARLRQKLTAGPVGIIATIRNQGYYFTPTVTVTE